MTLFKGKYWRTWKTMRKLSKEMLLVPIIVMFFVSLSIVPVSADVGITAEKHTGITIDGQIGDWAGIPGTTITMIRPMATSQRIEDGLEVRMAYDDSNVYVLILVTDDYDYNATEHHNSAAVAVLFAIDEDATPEMGGGRGYVDIWHWELDVGPGVVTGFNIGSGNDPVGNNDDEYALSFSDRHDDSIANELYGAWSHTDMSAVGAEGMWIFEFKRALTTSDATQDVQFQTDETARMSIGYWDADELGEPGVNNGWTAEGHYTTCIDPVALDFSWINIQFKTPAIEEDLQALQTSLQESINTLSGQIDSMNSLVYAAIGIGVIGILIAIVALARKGT
jgi:hypothetical protein